jgi:tetratricopeptide (TPR) repeat protein
LGQLYSSIKTNQTLALQSLAHFQEMAPNSAPSHVLLGDVYRQRRHYDDAQAQYKLALEISPADHAALLGLAYAYYGNANLDAAMATAKVALAANPTDPELNLLMGEALVSRHAFADAEPFLQKGLAAKPQMLPHVHALLGTVYSETGRTQDAIAQLEMGLGADQDGGTYYRLARLYRKTGDTKKADEAMQQVKALEQQRRQGAVIALRESSPSVAGDLSKP